MCITYKNKQNHLFNFSKYSIHLKHLKHTSGRKKGGSRSGAAFLFLKHYASAAVMMAME